MTPSDWLLLLVAARPEIPIDPVRLQKGLFLLAIEGGLEPAERYDFEPYSFGPMSRDIYRDARELARRGEVTRMPVPGLSWHALRLTPIGDMRAGALRLDLTEAREDALTRIRTLVDGHSFADLLEHVYDRYPEYATRSVFRRSR